MRKGTRSVFLLGLLAVAGPAAGAPLRPTAVLGIGIVGPNQYHQGRTKAVGVLDAGGFWRLSDSWSLGGIGLSLRTSGSVYRNPDEIGVALPVASFHRGRWTIQTGVTFQSIFKKNYFWIGTGISGSKWPRLFRRH